MNPKYFEYVIRDAAAAKTAGNIEEEVEQKEQEGGEVLDIPASWCERLDISRQAFAGRCYNGEKTVLYAKSKVESYAIYSQVDGLVERVTYYKDLRRQIPVEVAEKFYQPKESELVETFLPGRQASLKEFREVAGVRRTLEYYHTSRLDGLYLMEDELGKKISQTFKDRDDHLIYHSVRLDETLTGAAGKLTLAIEGIGDVPIRKMCRKYDLDPQNKEPQYRKIVFLVSEGKVRVDFHCEPGKVTYHSLVLWKDDNKLKVEQPATNAPIPTAQQLNRLLQMEKECTSATNRPSFVDALTDTHTELTQRRKEENNIRAWRSMEKEKEKDAPGGPRDNVLEHSVYHRAQHGEGEGEGRARRPA